MSATESELSQARTQERVDAYVDAYRGTLQEDITSIEADLNQLASRLRGKAEKRIKTFAMLGFFDEAAQQSTTPKKDWKGEPLLFIGSASTREEGVFVDKIGWVWKFKGERRHHLAGGKELILIYPHILKTLNDFLEKKYFG